MPSDLMRIRRPRALVAATRLAALYVIGVLLSLIPFMFMPYGGLPSLADVAEVGVLLAVPFGLVFLVLAAAGRAGFVVLWVLLGGLWGAVLMAHDLPIDLLIAFVGWSVLALPLHVLTALGITGAPRLGIARVRVSVPALTAILWTLTLVPALGVMYLSRRIMHPEPHTVFLLAEDIASLVWGPAPLLLVALSIAHAWASVGDIRLLARARDFMFRRRALLAGGALAAILLGLDVSAHFTPPVRFSRRSPPQAVVVHGAASGYGMRILRPDMSRLDPMPCLESVDADSTYHAGLPGLSRSPCEVASAETRASVTRSSRFLGLW